MLGTGRGVMLVTVLQLFSTVRSPLREEVGGGKGRKASSRWH